MKVKYTRKNKSERYACEIGAEREARPVFHIGVIFHIEGISILMKMF